MIRLRMTQASDAPLLLRWINGREARRFAFDPHRIDETEHAAWLREELARADHYCYIIEADGTPIGSCRLESIEGEPLGAAEVAITLADEHQGQGVGPLALSLLAHEASRLGFHELLAAILPENGAALTAFQRAGFTLSLHWLTRSL